MFVALAIWVKELTGSSAAAGVVFLLFAAPALAAPVLGLYADRFPRRSLLILTDLATAAVVLSLLLVRGSGWVWLVYLVTFLYGLSGQLYYAARSGLVVSMLPGERLADANSVLASIDQGAQIGAPIVGAALFAFAGAGSVVVVDAATFLVSVGMLSAIRVRDISRPEQGERWALEVMAGLRHILASPGLRRLVGVTAGVVAVVGLIQAPIFSLIDRGLHRPPTFLGVIITLQGIGSIAGSLIAAWTINRLGELRAAGASLVMAGLALALFPIAAVPTVLPATFVIGAGVAIFLVAYTTLLQRSTPASLQGRVFAAGEAATSVPNTISIGVGAALVAAVSFRVIFAACAAGVVVVSLLLFRSTAPPAVEVTAD